MGIQLTVDEESDGTQGHLTTHDGAEMKVFLWKGRKEKALPGEGGVIVEVQRHFGDAILCHSYIRFILQASEGEFDIEDYEAKKGRDKSYNEIAKKILADKKQIEEQEKNCETALKTVRALFESGKFDARELALQSLVFLTDPAHSGKDVALLAGLVVLAGSGDDSFIRDAVLSSVLSTRSIGAQEDPEEYPQAISFKNQGMAVVVNALNALEVGGSVNETQPSMVVDSFVDHVDKKFGKDLLCMLVGSLGDADKNMHDSCLAARCLHALCRASNKVEQAVRDQGTKDIAMATMDIARRTSLRLEKATEQLLPSLGARTPAMVTSSCIY